MREILIKDYLLDKGINICHDIIFIAFLNEYKIEKRGKYLLNNRTFDEFSECDVKLDNLANVIHEYGTYSIFITEKPENYNFTDKVVRQKSIPDHPTLIQCCFKYLMKHIQQDKSHQSFLKLLKLGLEQSKNDLKPVNQPQITKLHMVTQNKMNEIMLDNANGTSKFENFFKSLVINEKGLGFYYFDQPHSNKKTFYSFQFSKTYESDLLKSEYLAKKLYKGFLVWMKHHL